MPAWKALENSEAVESIVVDFCQFGTAWRKRTKFLVGNIFDSDLERLRGKLCSGAPGICSRTHRKALRAIWKQLCRHTVDQSRSTISFEAFETIGACFDMPSSLLKPGNESVWDRLGRVSVVTLLHPVHCTCQVSRFTDAVTEPKLNEKVHRKISSRG